MAVGHGFGLPHINSLSGGFCWNRGRRSGDRSAFATRSPVIAQHGIAATSQPLATQIAIDILKAGGSAVDAATGANAALEMLNLLEAYDLKKMGHNSTDYLQVQVELVRVSP
jgi:gamma-glutamyltranspeptidase